MATIICTVVSMLAIALIKGIWGHNGPIKITEVIASGKPVGPAIADELQRLHSGSEN